MNISASESETPSAGESGKRVLKANKACVPCRVRKIKCDAAAIGLPCSGCTSRQCAQECILPVRKNRTRKGPQVLSTPGHATGMLATSNDSQVDNLTQSQRSRKSKRSKHSKQPPTPDPLEFQSPRQAQPDLLYLNILNDVAKDTSESSRHHTVSSAPYLPTSEDNFTTRNRLWTKLPQLDATDNEYLFKKGVFDLPPPEYLDALVKAYFDHVYPFAPVIDRADFIRGYESGDCSLFLLSAILTPATLHVPADVLSACGFSSRSAAQESFFSKAKLLHDFAAEDDQMLMLQGSYVLCMVILDHPTDRDFGYWFHNAIRLATKIGLFNTCVREDKPRKVLKLCRRIWWALYCLDIFHALINTRHSRILQETSTIKPRTEDDWEAEDVSGVSSPLLSALTPQQKATPIAYCEVSRIFGQCLSTITNKPEQDPRQIMKPLDVWRMSLAAKMHVGANTGTDLYYLNIQAMSYRFECVLCRLMRRCWHQSPHADWSEWAKQRLRSAILELDTIVMRVLASGTLQDFPISFVTTITALLALHIESGLDPSETDLVRSMARISISQTMLILTQGKEIPVLKRALPVFEDIIAKHNLYLVPSRPSNLNLDQVPAQSQPQENDVVNEYASPQAVGGGSSSQFELYEDTVYPSLNVDVFGFDFLDEWQTGQLDFADRY